MANDARELFNSFKTPSRIQLTYSLVRLKYTRAILDAIHSGELAKADYEVYDTFNLYVPTSCPGVPSSLLNPQKSWTGKADFQEEVTKLGVLFSKNFEKYADQATPDVIAAGKFVKYIECWQT